MRLSAPLRHPLTFAALMACTAAAAEAPAPMSSLNASHAQDRFGLMLEQQLYRQRAETRRLPPIERRRVEQHLQRERLQLWQLQQRQDSERRTLQRRLRVLPPGTAPAAGPLQNQRFKQQQRSQDLHFKLFRPPHPDR